MSDDVTIVKQMNYDKLPDLEEIIERLFFEIEGRGFRNVARDLRIYMPKYLQDWLVRQQSMKYHVIPTRVKRWRDVVIVDGYENKIVLAHFDCVALSDLKKIYDIETGQYL